IGLLIARMLAPLVRGLTAQWSNKLPRAEQDRGWKVHSVVSTLQRMFGRGHKCGPVISVDEAMTPTRVRRNPKRQYLPHKPHKWGTHKPRNYYRSLFFGLVGMLLIDAFIVRRFHLKMTNQKQPEHYKVLQIPHERLLSVDKEKFEESMPLQRQLDEPQPPRSLPKVVVTAPTILLGVQIKRRLKPLRAMAGLKERAVRSCKNGASYRV
ncbi:hypothetical protein PHPALM_31506, partial [Phytophthora palmivora]